MAQEAAPLWVWNVAQRALSRITLMLEAAMTLCRDRKILQNKSVAFLPSVLSPPHYPYSCAQSKMTFLIKAAHASYPIDLAGLLLI